MSRDFSRLEPHRGQLILILGILSLVVAQPILGPIAWIMGNGDLKKMDDGLMDPAGRDNTKLGKILGMVATILFLAGLVLVVLIWAGLFLCCGGAMLFAPTTPR